MKENVGWSITRRGRLEYCNLAILQVKTVCRPRKYTHAHTYREREKEKEMEMASINEIPLIFTNFTFNLGIRIDNSILYYKTPERQLRNHCIMAYSSKQPKMYIVVSATMEFLSFYCIIH